MAHMIPYLNFNGNCQEAMDFYKECMGGELSVMTYGGSAMGDQTPDHLKNKVMHSLLSTGNFKLMAADIPTNDELTAGNRMSLCMVGSSKEEIEAAYAKISVGGQITHPLKEEFFGTYGEVVDKFGYRWLFQYSPDNQM